MIIAHFCHLIDIFCEIITYFYKVNLRLTFKLLIIFQNEHLLD